MKIKLKQSLEDIDCNQEIEDQIRKDNI